MAKVFITRRAEQDLLEIWSYIAQDKPIAADRQLRDIAASCERLAEYPGMSFARPEIEQGVRTWPGGVEIVRVVHGARDIIDEDFD